MPGVPFYAVGAFSLLLPLYCMPTSWKVKHVTVIQWSCVVSTCTRSLGMMPALAGCARRNVCSCRRPLHRRRMRATLLYLTSLWLCCKEPAAACCTLLPANSALRLSPLPPADVAGCAGAVPGCLPCRCRVVCACACTEWQCEGVDPPGSRMPTCISAQQSAVSCACFVLAQLPMHVVPCSMCRRTGTIGDRLPASSRSVWRKRPV